MKRLLSYLLVCLFYVVTSLSAQNNLLNSYSEKLNLNVFKYDENNSQHFQHALNYDSFNSTVVLDSIIEVSKEHINKQIMEYDLYGNDTLWIYEKWKESELVDQLKWEIDRRMMRMGTF